MAVAAAVAAGGWTGAALLPVKAPPVALSTAPPPGVGEQPTRLMPLPTAPPGSGGWSASLRDRGTNRPVGFDPCRPIRLVVNPSGAPSGTRPMVVRAFTRMAALAGYRVIDEGTSTEPAAARREAYQPQRYGKRWAPVLVAWTTPQQDRRLTGETIGLGGATPAIAPGGAMAYVTGQITLDRTQVTGLLKNPEAREEVEAAFAHEAGHVLGLDHVEDPTQLMYPRSNPEVVQPAAGDRRGLAAVGAAECRPDL